MCPAMGRGRARTKDFQPISTRARPSHCLTAVLVCIIQAGRLISHESSWGENMINMKDVERRVDDAIGSMAIEGIRISPDERRQMIEIASGKLDGDKLEDEIVKSYMSQSTKIDDNGFEP